MENNICNSMILMSRRRHFYLVGQSKHKVGACGVNNQASAILAGNELPFVAFIDGAVKTYIQSQSIPKSFYELKNNLIREFGTQVNTAEIHLQLSKTEKTSKETHIEYFYRVKEIASRINMEEEAEKYYIIRGLKENRAIEIQLQSCSNIEELKEKVKLLDIQKKSKSSKNEVIYPKYPVTRIPHHMNQFVRRPVFLKVWGAPPWGAR
ncbi:hypothetical protein TNCV_4766731 [Trichonephila clavipes]|nr:hypothetical protein TNCV_4766731 [Trichonephila clavipes]